MSSSSRANVEIVVTGGTQVIPPATTTTGSRGGSTTVASLSGTQEISGSVDAGGEDIVLSGNQIVISDQVRSADGTLTLRTIDGNRPIYIGELPAGVDADDVLLLTFDALSQLQDGFEEIVLGTDETSGVITLEGPEDIVFLDGSAS